MKKIRLTVAMLALGLSGAFAQGPDAYGYRFKSDTSAGGPAAEFVNILNRPGAVTVTGLGDDNGTALIPMGINFHYYYSDYSKVSLGVNGWISFIDNQVLSPTFPVIPTAGGKANNYIAAYMSDLNFAGANNPGKMVYWTNNVDSFVVTYSKVPFWQQPNPGYFGENTFQIILCAKDSSITINYGALDPSGNNTSTAPFLQAGIENVSGQTGLRVFADKVPTIKTVKFYYPKVVTQQVKDVATQWNQTADNAGFFVLAGTNPITLKANAQNVGNADVSSVTVSGRMKKLKAAFASLGTPVSIANLATSKDSTVTLSTTYIADKVGSYTYEVTTTTTTESFKGNDKNTTEMIAVDTAAGLIDLNYATSMEEPGTGFFGLQGDSTGAAVYIVPPFYPCYVRKLQAFMADGSNANPGDLLPGGFDIVAFDDNGPSKLPGTRLIKKHVDESETSNLSLHTVDLGNQDYLTITEGGFYVAVFSDSANVSVTADETAPFSNRTYEIIGGACSPYRQGDAQDFQIGAFVTSTKPTGINAPKAHLGSLDQNFPNPAKETTAISYKLVQAAKVDFVITNMLGQVVERIAVGTQTDGAHLMHVETSSYAPGMYYYTLNIDGEAAVTKKMVVSK